MPTIPSPPGPLSHPLPTGRGDGGEGIPPGTQRLFPDYDLDNLAPSFVIASLLEDGDSADLAWLVQSIPETTLAEWLERRGARGLSLRSRAFWEVVLGRRAGGATPEVEAVRKAIWPL